MKLKDSKMKIKAFRLALMALTMGAALPLHAQTIGQSKVIFSGALIADTCAVASESQDQSVVLPTVSTQTLSAAGKTSGSTSFQIKAENCPSSILRVAAHFEMMNAEPGSSTLKNLLDTGSQATGVSVQLLDSDGQPIRVGTTGMAFPVVGGLATMVYGAQYYALAQTTPGAVATYAEFTLAYP